MENEMDKDIGLGFGQWNGGYTIVGDGTIDLSIRVCVCVSSHLKRLLKLRAKFYNLNPNIFQDD